MMVIETVAGRTGAGRPQQVIGGRSPVRRDGRGMARAGTAGNRPPRPRPVGGPVRYPGAAVPMSRAPHGRHPAATRPITPVATIALALVAAAITVWLGMMAHLGAVASDGAAAAVPDRLGVVRVQSGESLQRLAARVAPDAPAGQVAERIRELNRLDSVTLTAGQTLIAPIG